MRINPEQGLQFAQMLVQDEEPLADITQVCFFLLMYLLSLMQFYCLLNNKAGLSVSGGPRALVWWSKVT